MRWLCALLLTSAASLSVADRVIFVPTGKKIPFRMVRAEYLFQPSETGEYRLFLGAGITREIDAEFELQRFAPGRAMGTFSASYNYIPPIIDTAPGVSFGVRDALDRTADGRLYYIATTIRIGLSGEFNSNTPLELTLGGGVGRKSGVFVGFELPFTWQFRLLAEHDIRRVTAGVEYRPFTGAGVRLMVREEGPLVGFRYSMRF